MKTERGQSVLAMHVLFNYSRSSRRFAAGGARGRRAAMVMRGNKEKFYLRKKKEAAAIMSRRVALEGASGTRPAPAEHTVRRKAAVRCFKIGKRLRSNKTTRTCVITFEMLRILF